jgi:hypothetical protein
VWLQSSGWARRAGGGWAGRLELLCSDGYIVAGGRALASVAWVRFLKHRRATLREWDAGETLRRTAGPEAASQYNPHLFRTDEQVRALELKCVAEGTFFSSSGRRRTYYMKTEFLVGACCGEKTPYVFAEECDGKIHGRPISARALRRLGVLL